MGIPSSTAALIPLSIAFLSSRLLHFITCTVTGHPNYVIIHCQGLTDQHTFRNSRHSHQITIHQVQAPYDTLMNKLRTHVHGNATPKLNSMFRLIIWSVGCLATETACIRLSICWCKQQRIKMAKKWNVDHLQRWNTAIHVERLINVYIFGAPCYVPGLRPANWMDCFTSWQ